MATRTNDNILVLEGEPLIAMDLEAMLASAGFANVSHVTTCEEALRWLSHSTPKLAVVALTDGGTASIQLADRLTASGTPYLVYSGHSRRQFLETAFNHAVWLPKPCTQADLSTAIDTALRLSVG